MSRGVVLSPEGENDVAAAAQWYEEQRSGLSLEFRSALDQTFSVIERTPELYPPIYRALTACSRPPFSIWRFSTWSVLMTSSLWQCCTRHAILVSGAPGFGAPANLSLNPHASPAASRAIRSAPVSLVR